VAPVLVEIVLAATVCAYAAACGLFLAYLATDRFAGAGVLAPRLLLVGTVLHAVHIVSSSLIFSASPR
jgi:hypothetical protein